MLLFNGNETSCMNHINSICTIFYFYVFILFHYDLKIVMQIYGVWKTEVILCYLHFFYKYSTFKWQKNNLAVFKGSKLKQVFNYASDFSFI